MNATRDEFRRSLLRTFREEAAEHLQTLSSGLLELEQGAPEERTKELVEAIFRAAHSLKGSARAVEFAGVEALCHTFESLLSALKKEQIRLSPGLFDLLHRTVDQLSRLLASAEGNTVQADADDAALLVGQLQQALGGKVPQKQAAPEGVAARASDPPSAGRETLRVSAGKLDSLLLKAEELLLIRQSAGQRTADLAEMQRSLAAWHEKWVRARPELRKLQQSIESLERAPAGRGTLPSAEKLVEFFEWNRTFVRSAEQALSDLVRTAKQDHRSVRSLVDTLLSDVKEVLSLPFSSILEPFPKLVRNLARACAKEVELTIQGGDLAIDRRVLEEIREPLIHAMRNAVDHGIEGPEVRQGLGKPVRGRIHIQISQKEGNKAELLLSDDGGGIDLTQIKAVAVEMGLIRPNEAGQVDDAAALDLAFRSGVSTSRMITDLSGRGLGLAILRERIEKLGGTIAVETKLGAGTSLRFVLPLTLASFRGVLVRVDDQLFVLPTIQVERVIRLNPVEIKTVENRETLVLNGVALALARLAETLEISAEGAPVDPSVPLPVLILNGAGQRIALVVDEVLMEQEVLVKPLGRQLEGMRNIAGVTVLGDGRIVPVLHLPDLVPAAIRAAETPRKGQPEGTKRVGEARKRAVLVAEDSITARSLLKNILESAGYAASTAVDGLDALAKLREGTFDLLVSDVEMPRMSGFELTEVVRADKRLGELPIVLITALESREDRERGIDVGASAYLVKSSFDQSNLLEVVKRLL